MAGDAPGCKQWGEVYDKRAHAILQACTNLADALTNFGYLLRAIGYRHGVANNSHPDRPTILQMSVHTVQIPSSVADNGNGLRNEGGIAEFFDELVQKVSGQFGKLPNGDIDKLARANAAWAIFGDHQAVTGSVARITTIADMFIGMDEPTTAQLIADHFNILKKAAQGVIDSAPFIGLCVENYRTSTVDVSTTIKHEVEHLLFEIGVTIAAAAAISWLSFGGSLAAAGVGVSGMVVRTVTAIHDAYVLSNLAEVLGLAILADGAVGATKEFDVLPDLAPVTAELAAIISKQALIYEASPKHGPKQRGDAAPAPTNPQETLDNSVRLNENTPRRVGYDPATGEFAIFDLTEHETGIYHGHRRTWEELTPGQQSVLIKAGVVDRKGRPL
ncbi:hypothetical protein [Nocardia sp. NPDC051750]|uniref:hypothetical protein n=1 Tax=Nocardia sp. NPDC051750 TaxID=3364325 RepID=UPI0037B5666A